MSILDNIVFNNNDPFKDDQKSSFGQHVHIHIQQRRSNKYTTTVQGLELNLKNLKHILKDLKKNICYKWKYSHG